MALILVVEPDSNRATQVAALVRAHLKARTIVVDCADRARAALVYSVPDVILMSTLLSANDEARITASLRHLGDAAAHVQVLTIPVLAGTESVEYEPPRRGLLAGFLPARTAPVVVATEGCDGGVFAEQVAEYVELAASLRKAPPPTVEQPLELILVPPLETMPIEEPELAMALPVTDELSLNFDFDPPDAVDAPAPETWAPLALEATPQTVEPAVAPPATPKKDKKAPAPKSSGPDEWGLFDPDKCGFAALLAQLDRLKHSIDDEPQEPDTNAPAAAY